MTRPRRTTVVARSVAAAVLGVLAGTVLLALAAAPAQAATYRYWTYWWGADSGKSGGGWTFAHVGPAAHRAGDGWVLGWRFATTTSTTGGAQPRQSASYADLCPGTAAVAGQDRVALVVDYGTAADAPPGQRPPLNGSVRVECLTLPSHPSGVAVLNKANVSVRQNDNGLLCALDGYPKNECAPVVADPTPTPTPSRTATRTPSPASAPATSVTTLPRSGASSASSASPEPPALASTQPSAGASSTAASAVAPSASASDPIPGDEGTLPAVSGSPVASAGDSSSTGPLPAAVGVLLVAGLGGSAWWTTRRRSP